MSNDELPQCLPSAMQNFSDYKHAVSCQLEGKPREKMREVEEQAFKTFSLLNDAMMDNTIPLKLFSGYLWMVKNVVEEMERDLTSIREEIEEVIEIL